MAVGGIAVVAKVVAAIADISPLELAYKLRPVQTGLLLLTL